MYQNILLLFFFRKMINADCTEKRLFVCSTPSFDQPFVRPCPLGYFAYKNKCYYTDPQLANFKDAEEACAEHGGQLVNFYERATYQFIRAYSLYYSIPDIFLGLNLTTNISTRSAKTFF
jgi:Lectin C-type domain